MSRPLSTSPEEPSANDGQVAKKQRTGRPAQTLAYLARFREAHGYAPTLRQIGRAPLRAPVRKGHHGFVLSSPLPCVDVRSERMPFGSLPARLEMDEGGDGVRQEPDGGVRGP